MNVEHTALNGVTYSIGDVIRNNSWHLNRKIISFGDQCYFFVNENGNEGTGRLSNLQYHKKVVPKKTVILKEYLIKHWSKQVENWETFTSNKTDMSEEEILKETKALGYQDMKILSVKEFIHEYEVRQ